MYQDATSQRAPLPSGWARVGVPASAKGCVLDFLLKRFAHVPQALWLERFAQRSVCDGNGRVLVAEGAIEGVQHIVYPRHPQRERAIPFEAQVLYRDAHILVADKPHFLPVAPGGEYVVQTLLTRLQQQLDLPQLAPLHRLDKDTAGLVLFSVNPNSRDAYHALFRTHAIQKTYEAVALADARLSPGLRHQSCLMPGGARFFTMQEVTGQANSHTHIELVQQQGRWGLYRLRPITGKKHQLRVHMAALGVPIRHDPFYPDIVDPPEGDYSRPLQLLARSLDWLDPVSGHACHFESKLVLQWPPIEG
ncbi:pseudouridine synthase [Lampropedia puyangensis]|uniref:Pseudouridine synthase n=1 Tax=Lampropedia puyangensis TaxID=1330072 RepID=A0A4S8F494_9BURK|nr:pseudouridine synthase [Lampropedia puyangensis]THU00994.1 pseudouridine synthase [Lampropedia puyangensis]